MTEENWAETRNLIELCEKNNAIEKNYYITVFIENGKPRFATTYKTPPFYCGVEIGDTENDRQLEHGLRRHAAYLDD